MVLPSGCRRYFEDFDDNRIADLLTDRGHNRAAWIEDQATWFCAQRYDSKRHKLSTRSLYRFLEENQEDALASGLTWKPAPSTLRRAVENGSQGPRIGGLQ